MVKVLLVQFRDRIMVGPDTVTSCNCNHSSVSYDEDKQMFTIVKNQHTTMVPISNVQYFKVEVVEEKAVKEKK